MGGGGGGNGKTPRVSFIIKPADSSVLSALWNIQQRGGGVSSRFGPYRQIKQRTELLDPCVCVGDTHTRARPATCSLGRRIYIDAQSCGGVTVS